ncbi:CLUMA_CG000348, isoform A [Clunio marinus]|uniref:CLUMA_CG000348, isoform A n=1 Tax=Clunio marinus TaxID=568069 RepID=A0A1J1HIT1_9DIPT|nr:CLUMA_CG000348, isoform A [Clunio marinus]
MERVVRKGITTHLGNLRQQNSKLQLRKINPPARYGKTTTGGSKLMLWNKKTEKLTTRQEKGV